MTGRLLKCFKKMTTVILNNATVVRERAETERAWRKEEGQLMVRIGATRKRASRRHLPLELRAQGAAGLIKGHPELGGEVVLSRPIAARVAQGLA